MTSRDAILAAVRKNLPRPAVPLPTDPDLGLEGTTSSLGYKEHFAHMPEAKHSRDVGESLVSKLQATIRRDGSRWQV